MEPPRKKVVRTKVSRALPADHSYDNYIAFDPVSARLNASFRLSQHGDLRQLCEVVPQLCDQDFRTLLSFSDPADQKPLYDAKLVGRNLSLASMSGGVIVSLQSSDRIYVMVDDPYFMGRIACSSVLGHLYGAGFTDCENLLMMIGIGTRLSLVEREAVVPAIMHGFSDSAKEAGATLKVGHTSNSPWSMLGGSATVLQTAGEFCQMPNNATVSQVLVLTKPLGATMALYANRWHGKRDAFANIPDRIDADSVRAAYVRAMHSMARSNRTAAILMHRYNPSAYINVSGGGLLECAGALAAAQQNDVDFVFYNMPIIEKMHSLGLKCGINLHDGHVPEYSGGLLIAFDRLKGSEYCCKMLACTGLQVWIVGVVQPGTKTAFIIPKPRVIETNVPIGPEDKSILEGAEPMEE